MNFGAATQTDQSFEQLFATHFNMADAAAGRPAWITDFNNSLPPDHRIWTLRQKKDEREQPNCDIGAALPKQPPNGKENDRERHDQDSGSLPCLEGTMICFAKRS